MNARYLVSLLLCCCLLTPAFAAEPGPAPLEEKTLKAVKLDVDGAALVEFFRKRVAGDVEKAKLKALSEQLADKAKCDQAARELVCLGAVSIAALRAAANNADDLDRAALARRCLTAVTGPEAASIPIAAARLLSLRKPPGAVEALMAYLPFADDDRVEQEVAAALKTVAKADGKLSPILSRALEDPSPVRRAVAAEVLSQVGEAALVERLLKDSKANVRLRVALALIEAKNKDAVPVLIALLGELPRERLRDAEDVLLRLAGEDEPKTPTGDGVDDRRQRRDAWAVWWKNHGDKVDLAKAAAARFLGYTLLVEMNRGVQGHVVELDKDGKQRWEIGNLQYPVHASTTGRDRVLITEYTGRRVTERNPKGEVLWEKKVNTLPISAERLTNGDTFIVTRNQLLIVDKDGKETKVLNRSNGICAARRTRDGQFVVVTNRGTCERLDAEGKEVKSFAVGAVLSMGLGIDVLPNGHVLIPHYAANKVVEYDADGKSVWETTIQQPTSARRMPNGRTLIASMYTRKIVEVDKAGKEVWSQTAAGMRLFCVQRR
jgi:hypothetical protein